jgi:hypothetical protein
MSYYNKESIMWDYTLDIAVLNLLRMIIFLLL